MLERNQSHQNDSLREILGFDPENGERGLEPLTYASQTLRSG